MGAIPFGPDVVTVVTHADSATPGELGTYTQVEATVDLPGCHHRPLTFAETAELQFNIGTELWRTTIPIGEYTEDKRNAALAVEPGDAIRVHGYEYQVVAGVRPFDDFTRPFKATIISEKHIG